MPRKRLPLTGTYNTRPGTGALSGALGVCGVGVVGVSICGNANQGSSKDFRLLNCMQITVSDPNAKRKEIAVVKRPGFAASTTPRAGHVGGDVHVWTGQGTGGKVMSAFGTTFILYDGVTSKGTGSGSCTGITETSISGTATLFITGSDGEGWTYQDGGSITNITDADYPGNASRTIAGTFAHLDGYPFIMDSVGRVYNGDLNSLTAWTAASYVTANSIPDVGVGVVRHRDKIIAFCKEHFDVFRNAGEPTLSPLTRVEELSQLIGCIGANAITTIRDTIYFVGTTDGANIALYAYDGGKVQKVSTAEQESAFAIAGPANITITKEGAYGRHFISVCASSSTFVYCVEENNWHERNGVQLWHKADAVVAGSSIVTYAISLDSTSGKVYVLNPAAVVYQDDGVTFTATIQTQRWDDGTNLLKFLDSFDVICDEETAASTMSIAHYDDDYQTISTPRTVDLSGARPRLTACGSLRRRAWVLAHSANTPMRIEGLELNFRRGNV